MEAAMMEQVSSIRDRKLVVLGIPFDVETEELKYYMRKFGELDDCIVMKDRITGQSRGFGYVTFSTAEDARKAASSQHILNGRMLDVKVATPKDEMVPSASKKVSRIFVARIPPQVTESMFRSYFQKYGSIVDAYMPKDVGSRTHRGIGFVTFDNAESVDKIMNETHELGGSLIAVDRATPKEETLKSWGTKPYDQSGKSFPDQWAKSLPEQWAKTLPDQWAKALPEQWAKMLPEQFGYYMAAAAAAAAQMGAFGGAGGDMEGFDFSSFGFPGFMGAGAENAAEGEAVKNSNSQVNDSPAGSGAPKALPSPSAGYANQSSAPQNMTPGAGYDTEAAQNNAAAAYGPAALLSSMYSMFNPENGYGMNAPATSMSSSVYGPNASHEIVPGGMNSAAGYGQGTGYSTSLSAPGYYDCASASTAQAYGAELGAGAPTSGATFPSSGHAPGAFLYSVEAAVPPTGHGYDNGVSYPPVALPDPGYGSSASYAAVNPTPATVYGSNVLYSGTASRYGSNDPPVPTMGNKVFIGKLPHEATAEHLRTYFSSFGRILDVYVPKDAKKSGHRGFGFVTFFDDGVAERVAMESHEILGQPIAVDRPTPQDRGTGMPFPGNPMPLSVPGAAGAWVGSAPGFQRMGPASFDYSAGGLGSYVSGGQSNSYDGTGANRLSRPDARYRPY